MRRAGMDYLDLVQVQRHSGWDTFSQHAQTAQRRLVLLTTHGAERLDQFSFTSHDTLLMGRESCGVPDHVTESVAARVRIPMAAGLRSLNVAVAATLAVGEALRQLDQYPPDMDALP